MEHLRKKFQEELTARIDENTGNVLIGDSTFTPDNILKEMDLDGYEESFNLWVDERNKKLLDKAAQILGLFDNKDRFNRLQETYKRGNVVPFIGAGMSISSGYPGWSSFLKELRKETSIPEDKLTGMLNEGQFEEAAQLIFDDMQSISFNEALENSFGHDHQLIGPVQYLPYVFDTCAITTNFDDVLKRSYDAANRSFSEVLLGVDSQEFPRYLGNGAKVLVKLHGKANSSVGRILTYLEYQQNYGESLNIRPVVEAICTKTLLFLGCSLNTDRTIMSMKELANNRGHERVVRHYAFLSIKKEEDRLRRKQQLSEANIFPIWYPAGEDHDEIIEALLLKLKSESK